MRKSQKSATKENRLVVMMLWLLCLALPGELLFGNTAASSSGRDIAVVVGVDSYRDSAWKTLRHAGHGAKAVAALLRARKFEVTLLLDKAATRQGILSSLEEVARQLDDRDRVLVYFAGHGYTDTIGGRDWGYIVPHDGMAPDSFISMREMQNVSELMGRAKHQLFIMDACFSGTFGLTRSGLPTFAQRPQLLQTLNQRKAREYITAGGKDQLVVDEGPDGHSVFTGQLLRAINEGLADHNSDAFITTAELVAYLEPAASNLFQTPTHGQLPGHQGGSFLFAVEAGAELPVAHAAPSPGKTALRSKADPAVVPPPRKPRVSQGPPKTYEVQEGSPIEIVELAATVAVSFSEFNGQRIATLMVELPGGQGGKQPMFSSGGELSFTADGGRLEGKVLHIDWHSQEVQFSLELIGAYE